eukprot:Polyplicarium_translucidae@DN2791_c1_g1_i1.p1
MEKGEPASSAFSTTAAGSSTPKSGRRSRRGSKRDRRVSAQQIAVGAMSWKPVLGERVHFEKAEKNWELSPAFGQSGTRGMHGTLCMCAPLNHCGKQATLHSDSCSFCTGPPEVVRYYPSDAGWSSLRETALALRKAAKLPIPREKRVEPTIPQNLLPESQAIAQRPYRQYACFYH